MSSFQKLLPFFGLFLWLCSCAKDTTIYRDAETCTYRGPVAPLDAAKDILSKNGAEESFTYQRAYLAWQVEHDNLVSSLGGSRLSILEAHRRTTNHLITMMKMESPFYARILKSYQNLYERLLEEVEQQVPPRILERKYQILKQKIRSYRNEWREICPSTKSP